MEVHGKLTKAVYMETSTSMQLHTVRHWENMEPMQLDIGALKKNMERCVQHFSAASSAKKMHSDAAEGECEEFLK